jgi:hypothetical protein
MGQRRFYNRLSGINSLSYVGVESYSPPDVTINSRSPIATDEQFNIGTFWLVDIAPNFELWQLASLDNDIATWIQLFPAGGGSGGASTFPTNIGTATQVGGNLNFFGANAITHTAGSGNTATVSLINGSDGQVIIGGDGAPKWANITSLGGTITITNGANSINLEATSTGTVVNLQGNTGPTVPPDGGGTINVLGTNGITTSGNAGTHTLTITTTNAEPLLQSLTGNSGGAVFADTNQNINLVGTGGVTVTGNPGTHTMTVASTGAIATSFPTDSGTAIPSAGALTMHGGTLIGTTGAGSTVTFNLDNGTNGQVIIGATAGSPAYANITSLGGSITITNGANSINLEATGAPVSSGAAVLAYLSTTLSNVTGDNTTITVICDTEVFDTGSNYNNATGVFTAPVTGRFLINFMVRYSFTGSTTPNYSRTISSIVTSNRSYVWRAQNPDIPIGYTTTESIIADMDAADTCIVQALAGTVGAKEISIIGDASILYTMVNFRQMG